MTSPTKSDRNEMRKISSRELCPHENGCSDNNFLLIFHHSIDKLFYMRIMPTFKFLRYFMLFLAITSSLIAYQEIPEPPDPAFVPLTFLQQERSVVLHHLKKTKLKGDETILHLGCRDGYLTNEIAQYLPEGRIIGLENTFAEEPQTKSDNVSFLQTKFVEQDWENCYDYIICTQFDEWNDNSDKLFYAIRKAVKPGGIAIVLLCANDFALPSANPLEEWLIQPENQEYAPYLQFWNNIGVSEFRLLTNKTPDFRVIDGGLPRMITCFRDLDQFKEESRKWFRKIAFLPMPLQDVVLNQLVDVTKTEGKLYVKGWKYYVFYYNLEINCYRKSG